MTQQQAFLIGLPNGPGPVNRGLGFSEEPGTKQGQKDLRDGAVAFVNVRARSGRENEMRARESRKGIPLGLVAVALLPIWGCGEDPTDPGVMVDSGSWYRTGFRWPHDGNPYETEHFIVYSDAASLRSRQRAAEIGEELLAVLKDEFGISYAIDLTWPPGQSKIHIYTYRDHYEQAWGGWGYHGGLLIFSLDHPIRDTSLDNFSRVLKHELMHVLEGLVKGSDDPRLVDVWLTEGIAELVAGGTQTIPTVETLQDLENLVVEFGELNPVAMHRYEYPNIPNVGSYYYVMFELTVRYLLDPVGLGMEKTSVRDIFLDARSGIPFAHAFEQRSGISLQSFEDGFFEWIRAYLR